MSQQSNYMPYYPQQYYYHPPPNYMQQMPQMPQMQQIPQMPYHQQPLFMMNGQYQYMYPQMQQQTPPQQPTPPPSTKQQTKQQPKTKETTQKPSKLILPEIKNSEVKYLNENDIQNNLNGFYHEGFCHFCNQTGKLCYYCYHNYEQTECKHGFCFDCLTFKFKHNPIRMLMKSEWSCPVKDKSCNCYRCNPNPRIDSDQFLSVDSVESFNKYNHIIENTKKIKKQFNKRKNLIKDLYSLKYQQIDVRKKKFQQNLAQKKSITQQRLKKQLQFCGEAIIKLKTSKLNKSDEQILNQVIRYNLASIQEQLYEK